MRFALLALLPACIFVHHEQEVCNETLAPAEEVRNPDTGQCQVFSNPCPCNSVCAAVIANPDWASCSSTCESLDEASCRLSSGCRAVYTDDNTGPGGGTGQLLFRGCWGTAPFDPTEGGDCTPLDAESCSRHDDCIAVYIDQLGPNDAVVSSSFERCGPELSPTP